VSKDLLRVRQRSDRVGDVAVGWRWRRASGNRDCRLETEDEMESLDWHRVHGRSDTADPGLNVAQRPHAPCTLRPFPLPLALTRSRIDQTNGVIVK
jgi:hypothetical protein